MDLIEFVPRLQQIHQWIDACEIAPISKRKSTFMSIFEFTEEEVDELLYFGLIPLESSLETFRHALHQMKIHSVESFIQKTLIEVIHKYPLGKPIFVQLFPMNEHDTFGRERLGGVSAWTNWEGDTLHLVVFPAKETLRALKSTLVHEYNHLYRITAMQNGHAHITLLEKIIREGLAEHFVEEVLGKEFHGPWVNTLAEDNAKNLWHTLYSLHTTEIGEHTDSLLFGGGNTHLPLWAGYSLGYYLVKWYRQSVTQPFSIIDLTVQDCLKFIPSSQNFE